MKEMIYPKNKKAYIRDINRKPAIYKENNIVKETEKYINKYKQLEIIPTIVGLALFLKINKDTVYEYAKRYPEFKKSLTKVLELQERKLLSESLVNKYNSRIAILLLSRHGWKEENNNTNINISVGEDFKKISIEKQEIIQNKLLEIRQTLNIEGENNE